MFLPTLQLLLSVTWAARTCAQGASRVWALSDFDIVMGDVVETFAGDFANYVVWNETSEDVFAVGTSFPFAITTEAQALFNRSLGDGCILEHDGFTGQTLCMRQFHPYKMAFPTLDGRLHFTTQSFWYNPDGHVPVGTYSIPHIDAHFYMHVTEDELMDILPGQCSSLSPEAFYNATLPIPEECWPASGPEHAWQNVAVTVPFMGNHILNLAADEFKWISDNTVKPNGFNCTWIYGTYNGEITFYEPMLSMEFLAGRPNSCWPTSTPRNSQRAGLYPTTWCIWTEEDTFYLELTDFVYHKGGCGGSPHVFSYLWMPVNARPLAKECNYVRGYNISTTSAG